ncbi:hypothetical protein [Ruegeria sp.]|uniref:hypothetical protein n=1 Tax=Ruegeria sp. TaxID=1879320 RepID=UPI003B5AF634
MRRCWAEQWVLRPPRSGTRDCTCFVEEVSRLQFGRVLDLPSATCGARARDAQVKKRADDFARPTDTPQDGDAVLMTILGARRLQSYHIGLYVAAETPQVLHWMHNIGAALHPLDQLDRIGLDLEGIYAWIS